MRRGAMGLRVRSSTQVQVHVVGSAEPPTRERPCDGDAADEGGEGHERADETKGHREVARRVGGVVCSARLDVAGASAFRPPQHQIVGEGELRRGGHRPPHVRFGHRPAHAQAAHALGAEGETSTRQERDRTADPLRRGRGLGRRMSDHRSASKSPMAPRPIRARVTGYPLPSSCLNRPPHARSSYDC